MKMSNTILDKEFISKRKTTKKANLFFSVVYLLGTVGLWVINYVWLNFIDEIEMTNIDIVDKWANLIFISTLAGYILTLMGLGEKFKLKRWVLIFGIISLIVSSMLLFGIILFYFIS